jgi:fucose 4-O-acetylase-like acetyltransferase
LLALGTVISGYFQAPQTDEGTAAHIFQLSIVLLVPMILLFLVTVDWKKPLRNARVMVLPAAALGIAFEALYYLEQYRWALSR